MGKVQSKTPEVKEGEEKPSEEPEVSTRELLEVIKKQQDQLASTDEEIKKIKEAHNKLVDAFSELGDKLEKGGGKGGLAELAPLIRAISPLLGGERKSPFEAIGVYTFKQFLRSTMGKKMAKKAVDQMVKEMAGEEGEEEEEEE